MLQISPEAPQLYQYAIIGILMVSFIYIYSWLTQISYYWKRLIAIINMILWPFIIMEFMHQCISCPISFYNENVIFGLIMIMLYSIFVMMVGLNYMCCSKNCYCQNEKRSL